MVVRKSPLSFPVFALRPPVAYLARRFAVHSYKQSASSGTYLVSTFIRID